MILIIFIKMINLKKKFDPDFIFHLDDNIHQECEFK